MDEENNESGGSQESSKKKSKGGIQKRLKNAEQKLNNTSKRANYISKKTGEMAQKASQRASTHAGKASGKIATKTAKNLEKLSKNTAKFAKSAGKFASKIGSVSAKLGPALPYIALAIVIIFIIVGLISYALNSPGIFWNQISNIISTISEYAYIEDVRCEGGSEYLVKKDSLEEMAETIDQMGYDLYGYGFINKPKEFIFDIENEISDDENKKLKQNAISEISTSGNVAINATTTNEIVESGTNEISTSSTHTYKLKDKYVSEASEYNNYVKVTETYSDMKYMFQYLVTDNYCYTIANSNGSGAGRINRIDAATTGAIVVGSTAVVLLVVGFISGFFTFGVGWAFAGVGIAGICTAVGGLAGYSIADRNNMANNILTGKGFIYLMNENGDQIVLNDDGKTSDGTIFAISNEKLIIRPKNSKVDFTFSLDKFGAQYGMPMEFLISTHIATSAPDLAYKLATEFSTTDESTRVNIKMKEDTGAKTDARVTTADGVSLDKETIEEAADVTGFWCFCRGNNFTGEEAYDFMKKYGIKSITDDPSGTYNCQGIPGNYDDSNWTDSFGSNLAVNITVSNPNDFFSWSNVSMSSLKSSIQGKVGSTITQEGYENIIEQLENSEITYTTNADGTGDGKTGVAATYGINGDTIEYFQLKFNYNMYDSDGNLYGEIKLYTQSISFSADGSHCSDDANTTGKVCPNCEKYAQLLMDTAEEIYKKEEKIYVPYVSSVTNHWYRNVYFERDSIGSDTIIDIDEEFEKTTGERWTLYEKYEDSNAEEQYVLLIYKDQNGDGNFTGTEVSDFYKDGSNYPMLISKGYEYNKNYYKKSDDGVTYEKAGDVEPEIAEKEDIEYFALGAWQSSGNYDINDENYTFDVGEKFRVGKKAISQEDSKIFSGNDSAYISEDLTTGWKEYESTDLSTNITDLNNLGGKAEYNISYNGKKQVEEGVRGSTNSRIKEIFLDDYYLFDGTKGTAAVIAMAKESNGSDDPDDWEDTTKRYAVFIDGDTGVIYKADSGDSDDDTKNKTIKLSTLYKNVTYDKDGNETIDSSYTYDENGEQITPIGTIYYNASDKIYYLDSAFKNKSSIYKVTAGKSDVTGPVNILRSSLSAFSILKNMGTEAAEYIYHDFKELIVELDYFDKEDLVEVENDVMMFPVSGISNAGWPLANDKDEVNYGTLIASQADEEIHKVDMQNEVIESIGDDIPLTDEEWKAIEEIAQPSVPTNATANEDGSISYEDNLFLQAAEDIHKYMEDNKYEYYTDGSQLGSNYTLEDSITNNSKYTCCATYVTWVCQAVGITSIRTHGTTVLLNQARDDTETFEIIEFTAGTELKPGDILVTEGHHTQIFAGYDSSGTETWYNAGSTKAIQSDSPQAYNSIDVSSESFRWTHIVRIKSSATLTYKGITASGSASADPYVGYDGGETVVAPVTGEVLKYGTVKRKNIEIQKAIDAIKNGEDELNKDRLEEYENALEQEVGFIKIKVANKEVEQIALSGLADAEGYNYFFEEYSTDVGISGYVLYIEGFDVSDILGNITIASGETSNSSDENILKLYDYIINGDGKDLCNYQTDYTIPNLVNDQLQKDLIEQELAKSNAKYAFTYDGKLYIKEGAVIGKTFGTASEAAENNGTQVEGITIDKTVNKAKLSDDGTIEWEQQIYNIGNYMRLILRKTNNEVVENVENYIETDKSGIGSVGLVTAIAELEAVSDTSTYEEKIKAGMDYFIAAGYTTEASAGIIGNLFQESRLDPKADNGDHHGLGQWNYSGNWSSPSSGRWKYIVDFEKANSYDIESFAGEIRGIVESKDGEEVALEHIKNETDVENAAAIWVDEWERSGEKPGDLGYDNRIKFAKSAYEYYTGKTSSFNTT